MLKKPMLIDRYLLLPAAQRPTWDAFVNLHTAELFDRVQDVVGYLDLIRSKRGQSD